jgi:NAD(P)-dependent dehydrogenase (short-subunit alcohol dehydrogenase family)
MARRFLAEGMKVVASDVDAAQLERTVAELGGAGAEIFGFPADVADASQVQALADAAMARFGAVHLLCNNAGVGGFQRFTHTSLDTWRWILGVDLWGAIYGCNIFLPILDAQDEAHIVNTSSMAGFTYAPYNHPYNVSKAGVVALTEGLYREFAKEKPHIGLSVLCPAFTATAIGDDERNAPPTHARRSLTDPDLEEMRQTVIARMAQGKTPEEAADYVVRGIRQRKLHIFTHPETMPWIQTRIDDILAGRSVDSNFTGGKID